MEIELESSGKVRININTTRLFILLYVIVTCSLHLLKIPFTILTYENSFYISTSSYQKVVTHFKQFVRLFVNFNNLPEIN